MADDGPQVYNRYDVRMELSSTIDHSYALNDDAVEQMLALAERLQASSGGTLDESAIKAVAEATGAPEEYVRLVVKMRAEQSKAGFLTRLRSQYGTLDADLRIVVLSAVLGVMCAILNVLDWVAVNYSRILRDGSSYAIFSMIAVLLAMVALANVARSQTSKFAFLGGAAFTTVFTFFHSVVGMIVGARMDVSPWMLVPALVGGGIAGLVGRRVLERYRDRLGLKDPTKERQELLRQLVDLQSKLKEGEQSVTFLSIDVVGSTKMKSMADSLSVEFTFNEYHHFIETITRRNQGRVHSTAGDGVTCAFESPQQGFIAARAIMSGLFELNAFRNKIGVPIELRIGVHTGDVVAPRAGDIRSVNFAQVIDISAHLQKIAPPGTVAISDVTARQIPGGPMAIGRQKVSANGVDATIWTPKQLTLPPIGATTASE